MDSRQQQEAQKGRYVETEIALLEEWADKTISQMFREGEELHFLVTAEKNGQVSLEEWKLESGDVFTEVTKDWLKTLPEGQDLEISDSYTLLQDAEGTEYLCGYCYRDEDSSPAHLWKETAGTATDITPEKWKSAEDIQGYQFFDAP